MRLWGILSIYFLSFSGFAQIGLEAQPEQELEIDVSKLRDPFKMPARSVISISGDKITILERFPTEQFRVVGIMSGPGKARALVEDPEGKRHVVTQNMKIGVNQGKIIAIRSDEILVKEKIVNVIGEEEWISTPLKLTNVKGN